MFPQWGNTFQTMDPNQQMYWQQYYGYQQGAPMWGNAHAPQPGASGVGTQTSLAGAAALPPEPPKEEAPPPPLPADPPPPPVPEEPQPPPDSHEQQKLTALQQQAAQWQQQKQWQEYQQSLLQYQQQLQQWNAQQASILEQINQEEKEFEMQYSDWMKQYTDWKEQNKNHPNREQYLQYEQQWKQYEEQMSQKREFIKQRKTQALVNQQMAQAPTTNASGFGGNMDQGVSAGITKPPESKPEPVSASSGSSFASSGFGGGMIYTSSGGQPSSAYPPSGSGLPYSGYGYGAGDYAMGGQGGAANPRFPQPHGGQMATPWPDHHAAPTSQPQGTDQSWNQSTSTTDYGMKHLAASDFGRQAVSEYEGQRQPTSSDFGVRNAGPPSMGFGMTPQHPDSHMRLQSPQGPTDPNTGRPRPDFTAGSDDSQNFMRKMEMSSSGAAFPGNFRNENQPGNRFQHPDMNTRFPGPHGSAGMHPGMFDSGGRPPGPHGAIRMPQQDTSVSHGPSAVSSSDSSYTGYGQGTDFSHKDANMPFSSTWGSASTTHSYDANTSNFMGPPRFPGPTTSQQSSEHDSRGSGPMGARMPVSSQQSSQYQGPSSSEQSKTAESAPFYPGMSGPRFPPRPPGAPEAVSSASGFPGNRFDSRSSSTQQPDSRFPGPRMPNQFSSSNQPQFDSEHGSAWSDESQNNMQQGPGASRFPGPRGPGMGPDHRLGSTSGQSRFSAPFGPGMRPDNEQSNSGGMRFPGGPRGPGFNSGFQQEQAFGNSRYPGPRGPGLQQDFHQDRGFGDTRFPRPHGPGMGPDNQQQQQSMSGPGGPRFPGSQGPRFGADSQQDTSSGEAKFPGPRGPGPRPEFGSGERFPRPRGPDFHQDPRFRGPGSSGPFGPGSGSGNQQGGMWTPRSNAGMDSGSRFSQQGPPGPNNFGLNKEQGPPEGEKKFSGVGATTSGPRPLMALPGGAQSSAEGVKTSAYEPFGSRGTLSQAGSRMPPPSSQPTVLTSDAGNKPEQLKSDGSKETEAAASKPSESLNKPVTGLNKESPQDPVDSSKVPSSTSAFPSMSQNFQLPGQGVRPSVGSQGLPSAAPQKFDPMGRGIRPTGPRMEGPDQTGHGVRPPGPRAEGPGSMGFGIQPPRPRADGPDAFGRGIRPPGPRMDGPDAFGRGIRPPGPRMDGPDAFGRGIRPPGPRMDGPDAFGRGIRPPGPRMDGPDVFGRGIRPPGPRADGPDAFGHGIRPPGPRADGPDAFGRGIRPPGPRAEVPSLMSRGVRPPGPRGEGPDPMGRGIRPTGPRGEGPDQMGRGIRPPGPRGEGLDPMGREIRPPGAGAQPRFPGGPDARAPGPRGPTSDASVMRFTKWQAPGGTEMEEMEEEVEQMDPELEHHASFGFDPRGRAGFGGGPRFPAPGLMQGMPRGMRAPFPRGPDPRFRPRMPPGVGAHMQYDVQAAGPFSTPADSFPGGDSAGFGEEEQEDFSQDFGEEGFFGKRKGEEAGQEFGTEETYEEEGNPPAAKFGRMDAGGLRPPFPGMPTGRGFGPRGQRLDAPFGSSMGMRPRFDPVSGRMVRPLEPHRHTGGPVPLMQLSLRPPVAEEPSPEDAAYAEEEYAEELETGDLETETEVLEPGPFMRFGPRGPQCIRGGLQRPPMAHFGPRGVPGRWPRPPMEEFRPGMGRGGPGNMRGPGPFPGFGNPRMGFSDDSQRDHGEESFIGLQPPDATYDEEGNPVIAEENWGMTDYTEEQGAQEVYDTDDPSGKVDSDGAPIQFSEREHELIKKAAEELKLLSQTMDPVDLMSSIAPALEKPKPPTGTSLNAYPKDDMRDETEEPLDFEGEREYLDRDDRFIRGERLRGRFHEEPAYPEEEFGAEPFASDSFRGPWHEEDRPRRPMPPDFEFRGPMRDFEPGFHEPPWRDDPDFREDRFPRNPEDFDHIDRRPFEGRWGPPPDWDRRSPPFASERGPRGPPLPPLPNPREFLENLENRSRPPAFGHGPPPRPPPFDAFPPPSGSSEVFDYGHGEPAGEAYDRHSQNMEPEDFWPDRDEDMRFRGGGWDRDRDLRHERNMISDNFDRDRRPPFPDIHERGGWPEHRERDFPGPHDRDRGGRNRDFDSRSSSDRGSREPTSWNREHRPDREREMRDRDREFRDHDRRGAGRDDQRDRGGRSGGFEEPSMHHHPRHGHQGPPGPPAVVEEPKVEVAAVDDLLVLPGRRSRPDHIVVIIRGPPGAGKTFVSRLIKDKEVANGGTAPRMLCLDDYFMVETEKMVEDPETRKKTKKMVMEYEYDSALEPSYKISFLKSFKRQIDDCYFNFIIVDAIFDKTEYMDEFWSYAKSKGFQVYAVETQADIGICVKRNTHQRKLSDIQKILDGWDETPRHYIRLDVRSLLQDAAIEDVEMEDTSNEASAAKTVDDQAEEEAEEEVGLQGLKKSKWEMDTSEQHLDKLDGIRAGMKKHEVVPQRLEDYLQLPDDYDSRTSEPGKKRVRWADIEERKDQLRRRELGFVVGQTDWAKMTDDSYADRALNRTKYF